MADEFVVDTWKTREGDRVDVYIDAADEYRWRVVAANGEIVIPPESHSDVRNALSAATRYTGPAPQRSETPVVELKRKEWNLVRFLLSTGSNNSQIAEHLGCSLATVSVHLTNVRAKANVDTTQQLMSGVLMRRFRFAPEEK